MPRRTPDPRKYQSAYGYFQHANLWAGCLTNLEVSKEPEWDQSDLLQSISNVDERAKNPVYKVDE
jgi:hypothetical protein